jgi:hypothetical protein
VILAASVTGLHFYLENHELTGLIIPLVFLSVGSILLFYFKPIGNFLGRLNAYWPWNPWPFFLGKLSTLLSGGFWFVFGLELLFWQIWRFNLIRTFIEWPQTWKVVSAILVLSGLGLLIFIKKAAKKLTEIESLSIGL